MSESNEAKIRREEGEKRIRPQGEMESSEKRTEGNKAASKKGMKVGTRYGGYSHTTQRKKKISHNHLYKNKRIIISIKS